MSTDSSAKMLLFKELVSPCLCFICSVIWWVHEAMSNITSFSFSQSLKFPWLKPFLWFKASSPQDSCKNANVFVGKVTHWQQPHGLSESHLIQCGSRVPRAPNQSLKEREIWGHKEKNPSTHQSPSSRGSGLQRGWPQIVLQVWNRGGVLPADGEMGQTAPKGKLLKTPKIHSIFWRRALHEKYCLVFVVISKRHALCFRDFLIFYNLEEHVFIK